MELFRGIAVQRGEAVPDLSSPDVDEPNGEKLGCADTTIRNPLTEEGVLRRDTHGPQREGQAASDANNRTIEVLNAYPTQVFETFPPTTSALMREPSYISFTIWLGTTTFNVSTCASFTRARASATDSPRISRASW